MIWIFLKPLHFRYRIKRYGSLQKHEYPELELKGEVVHGSVSNSKGPHLLQSAQDPCNIDLTLCFTLCS